MKKLITAVAAILISTAAFAGVLANPQAWTYTHPNFAPQTVEVSLNGNPNVNGFLDLVVTGPNGGTGYAQLQFQGNGTVVLRIHDDPSNLIKPLIVDFGGQVYP